VSERAIEHGFQRAAQPLGSSSGQPAACALCGRRTERVGVVSVTPAVCEFCAHTLRQEEAKRAQTGGPPPDSAYELTRRLDQHPLGPTKREV
jgi:ribosome-binding protein aMBF1 (putative translation factor)